MSNSPTLVKYANYLIGQPCKTPMGIVPMDGFFYQTESYVFIDVEKDKHRIYKPYQFIPLLITYDQLTDEQWGQLQEPESVLPIKETVRASILSGIEPLLTPTQTRLLLSWGTDIFDLIGKNLAEKREL